MGSNREKILPLRVSVKRTGEASSSLKETGTSGDSAETKVPFSRTIVSDPPSLLGPSPGNGGRAGRQGGPGNRAASRVWKGAVRAGGSGVGIHL